MPINIFINFITDISNNTLVYDLRKVLLLPILGYFIAYFNMIHFINISL
jgi:hypothetical protein